MKNKIPLIELGKTNPDAICKLFDILLKVRNQYHKEIFDTSNVSFIVKDKYKYHIEIIDEQLDYLIEIMLHDLRELPKSMAMFQPKIRRFNPTPKGAIWLHPYKELARDILDGNFKDVLKKSPSEVLQNFKNNDSELKRSLDDHKRLLEITQHKLVKERKKTKFKLAHLSDSELEKTADGCRFKNGKLNLTKLSDKYGVDPDTIKREIVRRQLTHLISSKTN